MPTSAALDPADEPLGVERVVAVKTAMLAFNGRVDRIDSRPVRRAELVIVDYKTGRTGLDADDARGSRALALYAYAAERVFRRPCRRVELHHLPTGTVAAHEHTERVAGPAPAAGPRTTARDIIAAERAVADGADPDEAFPTSPGAAAAVGVTSGAVCPAGAQAPGREPWARSSAPCYRSPATRRLTPNADGGPAAPRRPPARLIPHLPPSGRSPPTAHAAR